jgi:arabinogalactan endo-1,4-beta-galactosidase
MKSIIQFIILVFALATAVGCKNNSNAPDATPEPEAVVFAKGADVGWITEMEAAGVKFYDNSGTEKECMQLLKEKGINSIRLPHG